MDTSNSVLQGLPGLSSNVKTKFKQVGVVDLFPGKDTTQINKLAQEQYNSALERTVPMNTLSDQAGKAFQPSPKGDLEPEEYYAIDPIYMKNIDIYKKMGQRIHGFERQQRKAFIMRQITEDLANSKDWKDVIEKARAYRFALFKEQSHRKARTYDRAIKNIKMKQALAIHNLQFKVDDPLINVSDINQVVGDFGRNIKGTMSIKDDSLKNLGAIDISQHSSKGVQAYPPRSTVTALEESSGGSGTPGTTSEAGDKSAA